MTEPDLMLSMLEWLNKEICRWTNVVGTFFPTRIPTFGW
ncbi:protein of unknown function [Ruminococcaceae bacterium BL-4]|nr:protein of unknown function [Ruminococcaceae bacterium BL-4]